MKLQMDPLCDRLTTRPIQTGWEFTTEPYPSGQFGFIDDPDRQFGNGSVWTRTRTRSDGPEPLLTLGIEDPECPEQQDVSAAPNVHGLVRPTRKSKRQAEKLLVTVNAAETLRNKGGKKK